MCIPPVIVTDPKCPTFYRASITPRNVQRLSYQKFDFRETTPRRWLVNSRPAVLSRGELKTCFVLSSHQGENPSPFQSKHGDDAGHAHLGWNRHWTSKVCSERDESKQSSFFQMDSFEPSCVHQFMLWSLTKHFFSGAVQIYHVTVVFRRAASRSTCITHATLNTTRPKSQTSLERVKSETPKNLNPTLQVTNLTGRFEEAGSVARLIWAIGCRFYSFGTRGVSVCVSPPTAMMDAASSSNLIWGLSKL